MREVQIYHSQDPLGGWSARITGAFDEKVTGKSPEAAQQGVEKALQSHGAPIPYKTSNDPESGGQTIVYA